MRRGASKRGCISVRQASQGVSVLKEVDRYKPGDKLHGFTVEQVRSLVNQGVFTRFSKTLEHQSVAKLTFFASDMRLQVAQFLSSSLCFSVPNLGAF